MNLTAHAAKIEASQWVGEGCARQVNGDVIPTITGIKCVLLNIISILSPLLILVAFGVVLFAGARLIMAGDDPKQVQASYQTLTYAIIGIVGLALAWFVLYLIEQFTGAPVTQINLTP